MNLVCLLTFFLTASSAAPTAGSSAARRAQLEYLRGTLLERQGAYAGALAAYEKALSLDPTSAFIAGEAAELAIEIEDRERAEKWARRRLELAPGDPKSRLTLGRVLWARGDISAAEEELQKALESAPASEEAVFALVELVAVREPQRARELLEKFLKANGGHAARALYELGRLDAQEERYGDAIDKLKRSIALDDSESAPARLALAQVYEIRRDSAAAITEYKHLLVDEPDDLEIWAHIGDLQTASGDLEGAREIFRGLKQKKADDPAACAWLAADAERAEDFAQAARFLKDSAALKDDPILNLRLGYYLLQARGMKEAMALLSSARKRWPKDDRIAYYLALGHDDLGEHAEAVSLLRGVLSIKSEDRDARWQLATVLEKMNKIAEAELEFRRLLVDKPDDAPALNYLGYALADRGLKLEEAESLVRGALSLEPTNAAYRDSLGWVLFKLGRSTEAARELAAAVRSLPDDESVWEHLGWARKALGRAEAAWRAWRLSQSLGSRKAGAQADALQKVILPEALGELWRSHLESVHGGVKRFSAICDVKGRVAGRAFAHQALLSFRAPEELTFEILGPLFSPLARARVDAQGFSMDRFSILGAADEQVRVAAEGVLSMVAAVLAGEPYAPGTVRFESSWGKRALTRKAWRVELSDGALARSVSLKGGAEMSFTDFEKVRLRRVPKSFEARGRFWEFSLECAEPKVETFPDEPLPEAP
ncbi:MAG: tetratricopeptide repeat protein [Elusimicrobiota bacterium]